ncbi:MAG: hypothetical protein EYC70_10405 [Planctomycetota bacterium]|nr:MAG: hypothetical protein EYC70_10405 [Planctomycetota bacterium]
MNIASLLVCWLAQEPAQDLAALLDGARAAATTAPAPAGGFLASGTVRYLGMEGTYELLFDPERGAFRAARGGELAETVTWNGAEGWVQDWSGASYPLQMREREDTLLQHAVATSSWTRPGASLQIELLQADDGGEAVLSLRLKGGRSEGRLRLHRASGRPSTLELMAHGSPSTWLFSDWEGGLARTQTLQREEELLDVRITSVKAAPVFVRDPYAAAPVFPESTRFDPAVPAELEVKRVPSGHLLVHPRVDGRDLGWFILDSGAGSMVLDHADAEELGTESFGRVQAVGVGGAVQASFHRAGQFQLGPLTMDGPVFVDLDLSFLEPIFGMEIGGIVGFDVLARAVVEVDLNQPRVALHDPRTYELPRGSWQDLLLDQKLPVVRGRFEGDHDGLFRLDTGANDTLTFMTPAVERLRLLEGRETTRSMHGGVGGMQTLFRGKLQWLEIGGQRLEGLDAGFSESAGGAMHDAYTDANVGHGVLGQFELVFDYFHQRIAFLPRE